MADTEQNWEQALAEATFEAHGRMRVSQEMEKQSALYGKMAEIVFERAEKIKERMNGN